MANTTQISTRRVTGRQTLHFNTLDEVLAEVDRVATADREGRLVRLGNWTLGQNLSHLANWVNYSFDGVPLKVPWFVRLIMRPMKRRMLYKPMHAGSNIPKVPGGTIGVELLSTDDAVAKLKQAYARLKGGAPTIPHLLFGPLTHDEWINQHLRHAELHLSFLQA